MAISINVQAESRFNISKVAYNDQEKHGYNQNYIQPQTWRITLQSSILPNTAQSWEWQVKRRSDGRLFSQKHTLAFPLPKPRPSTGINLPSEGIYDCQLIVKMAGGKQEVSPVKSIHIRDLLIVVIGDSAAAGQGNPDEAGKPVEFGNNIKGWNKLNPWKWIDSGIDAGKNWFKINFTTISRAKELRLLMNPAPLWLEEAANRSMRSGTVLAARSQEHLKQGYVVTFLHFARSGSDIVNGLLGPRTEKGKKIDGWIGNISQIDEVKRAVGNRQIDALIISIGVNDVGFSGSLKNLVRRDLGWGKDTENRKEVISKIEKDIAGLDFRFQKLSNELKNLKIGRVFLTEYPTAIFDKMINGRSVPSAGCEIFESKIDMDITQRDAEDLKLSAEKLNQKLQHVAKSHNWIYVGGIADEFQGHGYCMGKERFFVTAEESLVTQGDTEGTMHPNHKGHAVIARMVGIELRKELKKTRVKVSQQNENIPRPDSAKIKDHREPAAPVKPRPARP
jgi:lysophospholipase L1-like esterase